MPLAGARVHGWFRNARNPGIVDPQIAVIKIDTKGLPPAKVVNLLEALYDGVWLELLTYPESYSREDARAHIWAFLSMTYPDHFDMPEVA